MSALPLVIEAVWPMQFLSGITILCFAASYGVALLMEVSRLFFRVPVRFVVMLLFACAGLFAHTVYLGLKAKEALPSGLPLSSWYEWCLLGAWVLAVIYVGLLVRRPESAIGIFILPLVEGLLGVGWLLRDAPPFRRAEALQYWGMLHGISLLLGTVAVIIGFVAGLMYLVQSYRLKHKLAPRPGFKLPSLEWLQRFNERALVVSSGLLLIGFASGAVWNVIKQSKGVPWTDRVIVISGLLAVWVIAALLFNLLYRPARQGRKVAYLTVASFIMLMLVLAIVFTSSHANAQKGAHKRVQGLGFRVHKRVQGLGFRVQEEEGKKSRALRLTSSLLNPEPSDLNPLFRPTVAAVPWPNPEPFPLNPLPGACP